MHLRDATLGRLIESLSPCVVDIGARGGLDEDWLPIAWATHVIGFEPEPEEAASLANVGDERWKQVTWLPLAVGGTTGPAVLHVPESKQGASLLRHNAAMVDLFGYENLHLVRNEIPVETVTLDELFRTGSLPRVDYLKIDIEGAELAVLRAAADVLRGCVALKVEGSFLPQRVDQPLVWELAQFLLQAGFAIVEIDDIHRWRRRNLPGHPYRVGFEMSYSRGQIAQCDLVALRAPDAVDGIDQALRLIVSAAVLGYFDYAISVLRTRPEVSGHVSREFGFDLESELRTWSAARGRIEIRNALRKTLRGLVPMVRSLVGRLPWSTPTSPY